MSDSESKAAGAEPLADTPVGQTAPYPHSGGKKTGPSAPDPAKALAVLVAIALFFLLLIYPNIDGSDHGRARISRVKADQRNLATGLEAYFVDNNVYPDWATGADGANGFAGPKAPEYEIPTFRIRETRPEAGGASLPHHLTTPIAYVTNYFPDPFAKTKGATYGYYSQAKGWILFSLGPDRVYDLTLPHLEKVYDYRVAQPTLTLIVGYSYDPSNGTASRGDVYRVKQ